MNHLSRDDLKTLMESPRGLSISIFMPTHRAGAEVQQNPIRFKNLLREAEARLIEGGQREPQVKAFLAPAQDLLKDGDFWQHPLDGLAVFRSPELFRTYWLPSPFEELVVVSDRFHVKPLLSLGGGDGSFYILALSQNEVRLLQGTRYSIREIPLEGAPKSLAEALQYDDVNRLDHFYPGSQGRASGRVSAVPGHGVGGDDDKRVPHDELLRYCHLIDAGLHKLLRDERAPLVLAGVASLFPIYREANSYPHLVEEGIPGNPEGLKAEALGEKAWAVVQPYFHRAQAAAADQYRQAAGNGRTSDRIRKIVPAAYQGRVNVLFVAIGAHQWGAFDPNTYTVVAHPEAKPGDEDLLDLAAVQTFLKGGTVYAVEPGEVPGGSSIAALFRY